MKNTKTESLSDDLNKKMRFKNLKDSLGKKDNERIEKLLNSPQQKEEIMLNKLRSEIDYDKLINESQLQDLVAIIEWMEYCFALLCTSQDRKKDMVENTGESMATFTDFSARRKPISLRKKLNIYLAYEETRDKSKKFI